MTMSIISGTLLVHLTILGIEINGDNDLLSYTAILTLVQTRIHNEKQFIFDTKSYKLWI
jgi:hypothetical protein